MAGSGTFKYGALYGQFKITKTEAFRNPDGTFRSLAGSVKGVNYRLAVKLQDHVAQALRQSLRRPRVSTSMLERVLLDQKNRYVGIDGFGVGIPQYLDDSVAKYWRQIDEGTDVHKGKKMRGLWGDSIGYNGAVYESGNPESQRSLVGELSGFGANSGQGFRPFSRSSARAALNNQKRKGGGGATKGTIKVGIKAHDYFLHGWESFGGTETIKKAYTAEFAALGVPVRWGGSAGMTAITKGR